MAVLTFICIVVLGFIARRHVTDLQMRSTVDDVPRNSSSGEASRVTSSPFLISLSSRIAFLISAKDNH